MDLLWAVLMVGAVVVAWLLVRRAAAGAQVDATDRFSCQVQVLDVWHQPAGKRATAGAVLTADGQVVISGRGTPVGRYDVRGESPAPPAGKAVFMLSAGEVEVVLTVPASSPAAARLRAVLPGEHS